ncbi:MAG: molybdate ABC transporter permease subunit [Succinivibrionaceae bacterium]|nr:molybdate ABC transporter permease subunit [Succinivibrionaceae bacterium]MBQ1425386.1 molybdate ABC transporter permease subunit [Succinivibrionaceae bacterium]MBQ8977234.1 molybdate ABC transporter permease subunit [Succinivibrionaceae bacterium]
MDLYPLYNSARIALISSVLVFFLGICLAYYVAKLPALIRGALDVLFTVPLVLPPTVVGYLLLRFIGPHRFIGAFFFENFDIRLTMTWWSTVFATTVVAFPLMYRTTRGAFQSFDRNIEDSARTLGLSDSFIFWRIRLPCCRAGITAGLVLAFARAMGEYGATSMISGYTPGVTATISTTVYNLWRTGSDDLALRWVLLNLGISAVVLLCLNVFESRGRKS